ncbi:hypothetical protein COO60DRAFT_1545300 [Scenedesmus sp. NREL 46B-D3]|nr:hypothetical protein COO60DRAFT_1545300 [Scenedesmus sp. NREL 46B-D3]
MQQPCCKLPGVTAAAAAAATAAAAAAALALKSTKARSMPYCKLHWAVIAAAAAVKHASCSARLLLLHPVRCTTMRSMLAASWLALLPLQVLFHPLSCSIARSMPSCKLPGVAPVSASRPTSRFCSALNPDITDSRRAASASNSQMASRVLQRLKLMLLVCSHAFGPLCCFLSAVTASLVALRILSVVIICSRLMRNSSPNRST